jgi:hypothetical protein
MFIPVGFSQRDNLNVAKAIYQNLSLQSVETDCNKSFHLTCSLPLIAVYSRWL